MVVKITSPHSLQRVLNYNEKKVQKGQAECIHAGNYLLNPEQMKYHHKLKRLQDLIVLNERTKKTNTLHISLNFDPSEKHSKEILSSIAQTYMDKIGFGNQPYLVYQHSDAGHPHIHIVTTTIQPDGKRIDTYNIGRNQSEHARKEIEMDFKLIKAQSRKSQSTSAIMAVNVQKVQYGKGETKRSISTVLDAVINQYKYTSLAELNAILKQYNVIADRGAENGRIYKANGLLYKLLDSSGNMIGVPIKASSIYNQPTLKNLEKKFVENQEKRKADKQKIKTSIDWVLNKTPGSLKEFIEALLKEKIQTVLRQNKDGLVYGLTFIDYRTKSVFNGSDLGKQYSIAGIQERLKKKDKTALSQNKSKASPARSPHAKFIAPKVEKEISQDQNKEDLLQQLISNENLFNRVSFEMLKKKKKKRNQNL
jgi:hypothetical protein